MSAAAPATPHAGDRHAHHHHPDYAARAHPEHVAIDIGGAVGALIIHTDPEMHGAEVEISREGEGRTGAHKQVLDRPIGERSSFTLLYDGLASGRYILWVGDEPRARHVAVEAGEITELDWRTG